MIKGINKLLKNKKGFTLVELIVVIAVLGILATMAVSRFAGFTEKAEITADEQLAAILKQGIHLSLIYGEIQVKENEAEITVENSDEGDSVILSYSSSNLNLNNSDLKTLMDNIVEDTSLLKHYDNIVFTISDDDSITYKFDHEKK